MSYSGRTLGELTISLLEGSEIAGIVIINKNREPIAGSLLLQPTKPGEGDRIVITFEPEHKQ